MVENDYSVGIVGCGGMGRAHADFYQQHEQTSITAVVDLNKSARTQFAEDFGVSETYESHKEMLAESDLDVISICTWHSTHAEIVIEAAEAGVDGINCEKPMATSLGEAEDMLDAANRNDSKLAIAHQRRFDPVHETAKELIAEGVIGSPQTITGRQSSGLLNWGTHVIDMARYLLSNPSYKWVIGQIERNTDRHERGIAIEDRCVGHICFNEGVRMTYESDMPGPEISDTMIQIAGSEGTLEIDLGSAVRVTNGNGTTEYTPDSETSNRARYLEGFIDWLNGNQADFRCSGDQAREVMEIMMAIYESARTQGIVKPPLQTKSNPLHVMIEDGDLPVEHPGAYDIRLPYRSIRNEE